MVKVRAQQFMNQFQTEPQVQEQGAVGGHPGVVGGHPPQGAPPVNPLLNPANPANFQIVNEYNSFNLANITPPIAQNGNSLTTFWMNLGNSNALVFVFLTVPCVTTSGKVKTSMLLIWARPDGEDI